MDKTNKTGLEFGKNLPKKETGTCQPSPPGITQVAWKNKSDKAKGKQVRYRVRLNRKINGSPVKVERLCDTLEEAQDLALCLLSIEFIQGEKMERKNVFFEVHDLNRLKEIAAQHEQSLAWVIRKVVSGFVKFVDEKQLPTSTVAEMNAAVSELYQLWIDFMAMPVQEIESDKQKIAAANLLFFCCLWR